MTNATTGHDTKEQHVTLANLSTQNTEAQTYFSQRATGYYQEHYGNINSTTFYPSLYLRHRYTLNMLDELPATPSTTPQKTAPKKALDIGCGSGIMVRELLDRKYDVVAADISKDMLVATKKTVTGHPRENHVTLYTQEDIEAMSFPSNTFDVVICTGVIEYLQSDEKAITEIARVLKTGGVAFISSQNKTGPNYFFELALRIIPRTLHHKLLTLRQHHNHTPWKLSKELRTAGLKQKDIAYHHFYPLPIPLDRLSKRFCVWAGKKMETWHKKQWAWILATGFILMVRKTKNQ